MACVLTIGLSLFIPFFSFLYIFSLFCFFIYLFFTSDWVVEESMSDPGSVKPEDWDEEVCSGIVEGQMESDLHDT